MTRRLSVVLTVIIMLLSANKTRAVSELINGSFEDDGQMYDFIDQEPNGWDVNMPSDRFGGWLWDDWSTERDYSLTIYSYPALFDINDTAIVSQWVNLADVNQIFFDLKLDTESNDPWDPNKCSAVLLLDENPVPIWESNDIGNDVRDVYPNRIVDVDISDTASHQLSLGLKIKKENSAVIYYAKWDAIAFDLHCNGNGFLVGDFSRDCCVNTADLEMFVNRWLTAIDPNDKHNLFTGDDDMKSYGRINFLDVAALAQVWDGNMVDLEALTGIWLETTEPNNVSNLYHGDDVGPRGFVNFFDFAIFAKNWLQCSN